MQAVRLVTGVASLPLLPIVVVRAALNAPRAAREHPSSRELRGLLEAGYTVTAYRPRRRPDGTRVTVQRGDDTRVVASPDLAFAAFAAQAVPRAIGRAGRRDPHDAWGSE